MRKILFLFLLIPYLVLAQREQVRIDAGIFTVLYSEVLEQPLSVDYKVLCPDGKASRKGMDFYKNDSIITSDNADYKANVWDKGHMAPAAAFNCTKEMLKQTFSYLNCALQHQDLNRGLWRLLEAYERDLASEGEVFVSIRVHFDNSEVLPTGATVPSGFTKKIYLDGKLFECYYFPNSKPTQGSFRDYKLSVCE
jgi:DNA/RNA endonuclease G (NUC1)